MTEPNDRGAEPQETVAEARQLLVEFLLDHADKLDCVPLQEVMRSRRKVDGANLCVVTIELGAWIDDWAMTPPEERDVMLIVRVPADCWGKEPEAS